MEQGLVLSLQFTAFKIRYFHNEGSNEMQCSDHLTITDGAGTTLMRKSCGSWQDGIIIEITSAFGMGSQQDGSTLPAVKSRSNIVNLVFSAMGDSMPGMGPGWTGWSVRWTAVTPGECQHL